MRNKDGGESLGPDNPIVIKLLSMSPFLLDKLALSYPSPVTHEVDALILEHSWFLVGITGGGLKQGQGQRGQKFN